MQDSVDLIALYIPRGAHWKQARSLDDKKVSTLGRKTGEWKLADAVWQGEGRLRLAVPGARYSVLAFWNDNHTALNCWYINLEEPLTRTARGFDYMDQLLDIIVEPDLKNWHWKDDDEFQEAVDLGLISPQEAKMFRVEGKNAIELLQSGKSIFNQWGTGTPTRPGPFLFSPTAGICCNPLRAVDEIRARQSLLTTCFTSLNRQGFKGEFIYPATYHPFSDQHCRLGRSSSKLNPTELFPPL